MNSRSRRGGVTPGDFMSVRILFLGLLLWSRAVAAAPAASDSAAMPPMHDHAAMQHDMSAMGHDHAAMGHDMSGGGMPGLLERTANGREASGTAWQPDGTVHEGLHAMIGPWMLMAHGFFDLVARTEGGPRGDDKLYGANMLMGSASRSLGPGRFGA